MYVSSVGIVNNNIEKLALKLITWSFGAFALLYILFLGNMVINIVERRSFETEARSLSSEVGDLELIYLSMSKDIDLTLSYSMGFKETKTTFANRKSLSSAGFNSVSPVDEIFESVKATQNGI